MEAALAAAEERAARSEDRADAAFTEAPPAFRNPENYMRKFFLRPSELQRSRTFLRFECPYYDFDFGGSCE